jgi:hypothetical protein
MITNYNSFVSRTSLLESETNILDIARAIAFLLTVVLGWHITGNVHVMFVPQETYHIS